VEMPRAARLLHQLSGLIHELIERRLVPPYLEDGNVIFVRLEKKARLASECIHVSADRNARTSIMSAAAPADRAWWQ
jgi:hypothetical protein